MDIVTRAEWDARPPKSRHFIDTPTAELWLHHTAGALDAGGNGVWWDDVQGIQNFHMDGRGWSDIAYSFLVGGGQIFEGRGVGVAGGHTKGHNTRSHAICLIGNYEFMHPTDRDLEAIAELVAHGRESGWWGDLTGDHSAASGASTACCGRNLRRRIPEIRAAAGAQPAPEPDPEEDEMGPTFYFVGAPAGSTDARVLVVTGGHPELVPNMEALTWHRNLARLHGEEAAVIHRPDEKTWRGLLIQAGLVP